MSRCFSRTSAVAAILPLAATAGMVSAAAAHNEDGGSLDTEDDTLWHAHKRTRKAISEAQPQIIGRLLVKIQAAKAEARQPDGSEQPRGGQAAEWGWDLMRRLLRRAEMG